MRFLISLSFSFLLTGCTLSLQKLEFYRARTLISAKKFESAIRNLEKVINNDPNSPVALQAAALGAPIAHLEAKNYQAAVRFYQHVIYKSPVPDVRLSAQKSIAQIFFENLHDYDQAILEYENLLRLKLPDDEIFKYRLNIVKSHLQLNNLEQAFSELDSLIKQSPNRGDLYEAKVLKANIFISNKKYMEAAAVLSEVIKDNPERAKKENLHLSLVVCYEDSKEFGRAIEVLEGMRGWYSHPDFLDLRIKRLVERSSNQPGAQGWKR